MTEPPPSRMATASMVLGLVSLPTLGILGVGAFAAVALGIVALMRANREPQTYGGKGRAIAGIAAGAASLLVALPLAGIVAAIVIPSRIRAKVAGNEAATIADIHAVIVAEAAYQKDNDGYFGPRECLIAPQQCLPGHAGKPYLEPAILGDAPRSGYRLTFHRGATATAPPPKVRLMSFAVTTVPETLGKSGVRGFCGDNTGRYCYTTDGTQPPVVEGVCGTACRDFR